MAGDIAQELLVRLEREAQEWPRRRVARLGEIVVLESGEVVAERQPHVAAQVVADVDPCAVVHHLRIPGMHDARPDTRVPALAEAVSQVDTHEVRVARKALSVELAANILERVLQRQRGRGTDTTVCAEVVDQAPALLLGRRRQRAIVDKVDAIED